jgi:DNA repair protein RadC
MKTYKTAIKEYSLIIKEKDTNFLKSKITSSRNCYDYIKQFYFDDIEIYESFFIVLLNRANNTIGYVKISQGGTTGTVVDIKIIAKYAIDCLANSVILAHNHPSGNTQPSEADIKLTKKCKEALSFLDITTLDHIILTPESFYSFADEGLI